MVLDLNVLKPDVVAIEALVDVLGQRGIRIYAIELDGGAELGAHLPPVLVGAKEATTDGLLQPAARRAGRRIRTGPAGSPAEARDEAGDGRAGAGKAAKQGSERAAAGRRHADDPLADPLGPVDLPSAWRCHRAGLGRFRLRDRRHRLDPCLWHAARPRFGRALGNTAARIFCRRNEAELLSVDGWYCTAEEMEPSVRGKPVQAFLDNGMLRIAPFS